VTFEEQGMPVKEILDFLKIGKSMYYRYLEYARENPKKPYKSKRRGANNS